MTLEKLLNELKRLDLTQPLIFTFEGGGEIGSGYHVTEIKSSDIKGIDCSGRMTEWSEALVQLLDGQVGQHMKGRKFVGIIEHCLKNLEGLEAKPLFFEFAAKNAGLHLYSLKKVEVIDGRIIARLIKKRAICKPANLFMGNDTLEENTNSSCCGQNIETSACCA